MLFWFLYKDHPTNITKTDTFLHFIKSFFLFFFNAINKLSKAYYQCVQTITLDKRPLKKQIISDINIDQKIYNNNHILPKNSIKLWNQLVCFFALLVSPLPFTRKPVFWYMPSAMTNYPKHLRSLIPALHVVELTDPLKKYQRLWSACNSIQVMIRTFVVP